LSFAEFIDFQSFDHIRSFNAELSHKMFKLSHKMSEDSHKLCEVSHKLSEVPNKMSEVYHKLSEIRHKLLINCAEMSETSDIDAQLCKHHGESCESR